MISAMPRHHGMCRAAVHSSLAPANVEWTLEFFEQRSVRSFPHTPPPALAPPAAGNKSERRNACPSESSPAPDQLPPDPAGAQTHDIVVPTESTRAKEQIRPPAVFRPRTGSDCPSGGCHAQLAADAQKPWCPAVGHTAALPFPRTHVLSAVPGDFRDPALKKSTGDRRQGRRLAAAGFPDAQRRRSEHYPPETDRGMPESPADVQGSAVQPEHPSQYPLRETSPTAESAPRGVPDDTCRLAAAVEILISVDSSRAQQHKSRNPSHTQLLAMAEFGVAF